MQSCSQSRSGWKLNGNKPAVKGERMTDCVSYTGKDRCSARGKALCKQGPKICVLYRPEYTPIQQRRGGRAPRMAPYLTAYE